LETRRLIWAALALALSARLFDEAKAQDVTTYLETSGTEQKPRSNAGLSVEGDKLRMRADFAVRAKQVSASPHALQPRPAGSTEVVPNLRSAFTLAKNLDIETRVNFAEWNAHSDTTFDTRVRYRKPLDAFFDELDGSLWRSPDGVTKQSLRLGFNETFGDEGAVSPLTISGAAIFEASPNAAAAAGGSSDSHRVGVETRLAGFMPAFLESTSRRETRKVRRGLTGYWF
jgi:hypothetical protein